MLALIAAMVLPGLTGCASTWDTLSSRRFREKPWEATFGREEPMQVLRTNPDGEARARAMRNLTESELAKLPDTDRNEAFELCANAATTDASPWVRMAAIDALGKFDDPRTTEMLAAAFHQAAGRSPGASPIQQVSAREPGLLGDRLGLTGPQGFPGEVVANLRGRALDSLAKTNRPEAIEFLARTASGSEDLVNEDPSSRDFTRQRAVAGLGKIRHKDAVVALAKVLATEQGRDLPLSHMAHEGLVSLTGKKHPADPEVWNGVVQAGFEIAPEPSAIERAVGSIPID